jgi:hypothetical protein
MGFFDKPGKKPRPFECIDCILIQLKFQLPILRRAGQAVILGYEITESMLSGAGFIGCSEQHC